MLENKIFFFFNHSPYIACFVWPISLRLIYQTAYVFSQSTNQINGQF